MTEAENLDALVRPMPRSKYGVDHAFNYVEKALASYDRDYGLDLTPDFQRGHVWTQDQQERWIEAVIRGAISSAGLMIQFNAPGWESGDYRKLLPETMVCIDGLQRLTAVRAFMAGNIRAFGRTVDQLKGSKYDARRYLIHIAVHSFQTRAELLQYYLDLNAGGTPHSSEEIERVRKLKAESV